jgi:tRNA-splicing ligase RtcB
MPVFKEIPATVTGHVPVKIWTDQVEESAAQQLTALAACPFIFHHVAAMPDVHYGMGATIGSVFPAENVLLPTAVGVDIGCFTGDTLVPLLDGTDRPIKDLAEHEGEFWIWSVTPSHRITAAKATAKRTRENAPLVRVLLDNGAAITCTPDHKFMLRDGSWSEAASLSAETSLMPLYKKIDRDGYVMICQPYSGRWQRAHWAVARTGALGNVPRFTDQWVVHRKNFIYGQGPANHKVVSVEVLDRRDDVYCLTVPEYGNFALSAGVFVHNCGMLAQPFNVRAVDLSTSFLRELHELIKKNIPTGFGGHPDPQEWEGFEDETRYTEGVAAIVREKGPMQLGSLGGGNHFLELCQDEDGMVWLMLHSGSRGAGNMIATYHIAIAEELNKELNIPSARDLWVLPLDRDEGQAYLRDMLWAQDYAMENRQRMRWTFIQIFSNLLRKRLRIDLDFDPAAGINIHHNYANPETHFGREVWVHRKGATFAGEGVLGIIPGSMATGSYIVRGLGNPESFRSCSHGAGRVMSRGEAVRSITLEAFAHKMKGIVAETGKEYLDEAPQAYKDLDTVILNQADLVEPVRRLRPIMNVKGAGKTPRDRTRDRDDPVQKRKEERRKRR